MSGRLAELEASLTARFGPNRVHRDAPLARLSTFKVGGPADLLFEPGSSDDLAEGLRLAARSAVPVTLLGGGSNVLIADAGVRGLVMRPRGGAITQVAPDAVRADAAVTINGLVRWTIGRGLSGLEAWAGTPGTVGGGVFGNAHWQGRLLSEQLQSMHLAASDGDVLTVPVEQMEFGYDRSRLQRTGEILLSAVFRVGRGEPEALRAVARASLAYRKQTQPLHAASAGCVFQNPSPDERLPPGVPHSAGALIDRAGLKGYRIGGAEVSTTHANFIVNTGTATAADIKAVLEHCKQQVARTSGVALREEIVYLGGNG
jgi:UDP-N-acetylmuramate dehydrogenase